MQKKRTETASSMDRPSRLSREFIYHHRRILLVSVLAFLFLGSGILGYLIGRNAPAQASVNTVRPAASGLTDVLIEQENRCAAIEQINVQQELQSVQNEADRLSEFLVEQQEVLEQQQEEMESLEERIINSLMANLSEKTISRSSPTVASYVQQARDLLVLQRKVRAFERTSDVAEVDLSEYKEAIQRRLANIPTLKPIPGRLTGYGYRRHPIFGYHHFHAAVDMGASTGTPIKAAAAGRVSRTGYNSRSGNYVYINHGNGFETLYYHCHRIHVSVGERVSKGQVLATVGNTGTSTTPHLHFGISFYGTPINPNQIIME